MPKPFDDCVNSGGNVTTKKVEPGKYIHICWKNGKSYAGYVKTVKKPKAKKK